MKHSNGGGKAAARLTREVGSDVEIPSDRLDLFFAVKAACGNLIEVTNAVIFTRAGVRDGARILQYSAERVAKLAKALADSEDSLDPMPPTRQEVRDANKTEMAGASPATKE